MSSSDHARGLLSVVGAFLIWGLLPIYLKLVSAVSLLEIMLHRALWCCAFVLAWLAWRGALGQVKAALTDGGTVIRLAGSATLITINWFVYVYAVNTGHVIEASLGYFINPLFNVVLGVLVLRERLNPWQWLAVGCAAVGVAYLTWVTGRLPWMSLALAVSFGLYGLIRKTVAVEAVAGLACETLLMVPFGLIAIGWLARHEGLSFTALGPHITALLVFGGVLTAVPLALFANGARLIPYSTVGLVQYLGPTLQLSLGVWVYHEPMPQQRLIGFACIWLALLMYAADRLHSARRAGP